MFKKQNLLTQKSLMMMMMILLWFANEIAIEIAMIKKAKRKPYFIDKESSFI